MTGSDTGVARNCDIKRGSIVHTSPRLPENMQRDSLELSPIVLLMESSKTDPPLSLMTAIPGKSVHCTKRKEAQLKSDNLPDFYACERPMHIYSYHCNQSKI